MGERVSWSWEQRLDGLFTTVLIQPDLQLSILLHLHPLSPRAFLHNLEQCTLALSFQSSPSGSKLGLPLLGLVPAQLDWYRDNYAAKQNVSSTIKREREMAVLKKKKNRITIQSNNPTPRHIAKKEKTYNLKRYMHPSDHSSTIYNSQDMETNLNVHPEMNG